MGGLLAKVVAVFEVERGTVRKIHNFPYLEHYYIW